MTATGIDQATPAHLLDYLYRWRNLPPTSAGQQPAIQLRAIWGYPGQNPPDQTTGAIFCSRSAAKPLRPQLRLPNCVIGLARWFACNVVVNLTAVSNRRHIEAMAMVQFAREDLNAGAPRQLVIGNPTRIFRTFGSRKWSFRLPVPWAFPPWSISKLNGLGRAPSEVAWTDLTRLPKNFPFRRTQALIP